MGDSQRSAAPGSRGVALMGGQGEESYDDAYGGGSAQELSQYAMDLDGGASDDEDGDQASGTSSRVGPSRALLAQSIADTADSSGDMSAEMRETHGSGLINTRITDRESSYHQRRLHRDTDSAAAEAVRASELVAALAKATATAAPATAPTASASASTSGTGAAGTRRKRWADADALPAAAPGQSSWDSMSAPSSSSSQWGETPAGASVCDETPVAGADDSGSRWGETPLAGSGSDGRKRSRWDETPLSGGSSSSSAADATPGGSMLSLAMQGSLLPSLGSSAASAPLNAAQQRYEAQLNARNRPLSDAELDAMFPSRGYQVLEPPPGYAPAAARGALAAPEEAGEGEDGFTVQQTLSKDSYGVSLLVAESGALPTIKPEDYQYFGKLLDDKVDTATLSAEELKERRIMTLLLKIKSGAPPQRKVAMRQIADKAREFGPDALFSQILPLLMSPALEDQERHLLVKVIDRVLLRLGVAVRPYVHQILQVIEPLLIDEDYYARVEGREIISNLAKAAGLSAMISTMREDIDSANEYVRNTTARAFAVVASALGIPKLLPFLQAVCQSRKSWEARHTGIKIVQQIAVLMGAAILPHLKFMVAVVQHGLTDSQLKVRTIAALAVAAMAESAFPYGIEAFDDIIRPLWTGARQHHGKPLAAFLKAVGFLVPLMEEQHAAHYTRQVMVTVVREFANPDEEMKKVVLKVVQQCVSTDGVEAAYVREILPDFFRHFWARRMALDRRNYRSVVQTTVELANKVGSSDVVGRIADDLKDESAPYRNMVMETVEAVLQNLGAADLDTRLEERLVDGMLFAFQEQADDDSKVILNGFGTVVAALGGRMKPYFPQICGTIKWRLNNKSANVRMQAADLTGKIAPVMQLCQEDQLMGHLGVVLYEYLGEEYPDVLGSILGALGGIVAVIGMDKMTPPIRELLPRLTPIMKNRHEKVQEHCIDLVGRIADRGAEFVSPREWMRICFELLEMLKANKKVIQKAAVRTFGFIAKSIGPQDVLHTLLNNLKVQERTMRVCTTVAIAIVAETCAPFTVIPALMNEYRTPDVNVQNGVLKALSFLFEYVGDMAKDYLYAVSPLLVDALIDRDNVHRQTAATAVKHIALGVAGSGCEDVLGHLLNYVWPNVFEESPHVINATMEAIEALMVALGPAKLMMYVLQGLFHPARKVRETYWRVYNTLYILAQDGMVASYPLVEDEGHNTYRRTELELFL